MISDLAVTLVTVWPLDLAAAVALAGALLFYRRVISKEAARRNRARALRWRARLRLRPAPGYASLAELAFRWSAPAAVFHGKRARPGLRWHARVTMSATQYAVRLGRAQYFLRVFARMEDQVLVLAPQRTGKSGLIADRIVDHPGAVLATSTKADLLAITGADRSRRGPVHVFNPQGIGGAESTLRWDLIGPCNDLVMARRMASWLTGGSQAGHGNIEWFEQKGEVALAALLFAASVLGATISDVFRWVQLDGHHKALEALANYGTPEMLAVAQRMLADNRTAGSVRDTIELALSWAAIPELAEAVTPREGDQVFSAEDFTWSRGTLYMIASGDKSSPVAPLFRALAAYVHCKAGLMGTMCPDGRLDPPLLMALDEVAVICPVPLPEMLADAAGKGILIMPVVHGVSQLEDKWGTHGAATIWATCGTKVLLPGISDDDTLESVSRLCGTVTDGTPDHERTVRVVPPELLRTLPDWHALVVRMNLSPVIIRFRPVWKRPERRFPLRYLRPAPGPRLPTPAAALPLDSLLDQLDDIPGLSPEPETADPLEENLVLVAPAQDQHEEGNAGD